MSNISYNRSFQDINGSFNILFEIKNSFNMEFKYTSTYTIGTDFDVNNFLSFIKKMDLTLDIKVIKNFTTHTDNIIFCNKSYEYLIKSFKFNTVILISSNSYYNPPNIEIKIFSVDNSSVFIDAIIKYISSLPFRVHPKCINIIKQFQNGFSLIEGKIKFQESSNISIDDLYNDDFKDISEDIINKLNTADTGIVLLHGIMGSGKTSYLRYLLSVVNKQIIYLPPDLAPSLSNPGFIEFLMGHPETVLVIEDAENVLKHREASGTQAVSNILNISDGILGDVLKIQFVCTFNCDLSKIDNALLRPGRLIAEYQFTELTLDKTRNLIQKIYKEDANSLLENIKPMTLAEIFNLQEKLYKTVEKKTKIGFI